MRYATITPAVPAGQTAEPWVIADDAIRGPGSKFIAEAWPGFEQIVRDTAYLNGVFTVNEGKGNRSITFSLVVDHEFADQSQCFLFAARLATECPSGGLLEIGTRGTGGAKVFYPGAVIVSVTPFNVTEVSMTLRYEIKAGAPAGAT